MQLIKSLSCDIIDQFTQIRDQCTQVFVLHTQMHVHVK